MSIDTRDLNYNMKLSFNKFLYERVSGDYYLNYLAPQDETPEMRRQRNVTGWWKWLELNWIDGGWGVFSKALLQINCNTVIDQDVYGIEMERMAAVVQDELNLYSIPFLDFSDFVEAQSAGLSLDPSFRADISKYPPVPVDKVLIPRFRGVHPMPNAVGDTVAVKCLDYNIHEARISVLP